MILPEEMECITFLQNLGEPYATRVASLALLKECQAGAILFRAREDCTHIYFVLQGSVGLEIEVPPGKSIPVQTVGRGELLGWSALLRYGPTTATARARERCRLAALPVEPLLALFDDDPRLGQAFMRQLAVALARRLEATRLMLSS